MRYFAIFLCVLLLVACAQQTPQQVVDSNHVDTNKTVDNTPEPAPAPTPTSTLLPLGDHKISTSPKKGYIYACQTNFNGGGAFNDGAWIQGNEWNPAAKPAVDGHVDWQNSFAITVEGDERIITSNGLPNHETGTYPIKASDDAYSYDRNPNSIKENEIALHLPLHPILTAEPTCVGMGMVGVLTSGAALFNGFDAQGRDAPAHEIQDACNGHPQEAGIYHYHDQSPCIPQSGLIGYALDGFPIYGEMENGTYVTNDDLDECHGKTINGEYRYYMTREYPYSIGCFKGTPVKIQQSQSQAPQQNGPPQEAKAACTEKSEGSSCSFQAPDKKIIGTCRNTPDGMACVPV